MMVLNCSVAAAAHLYGKYKKGQDEGFFELASSNMETIEERQKRLNVPGIIQWVVHAVKIGLSTVLIAMEYNTRWVHVIHQVRKGDINGFIERLNTRLVNGIAWLGTDFSLFTSMQIEAAIERYFTLHKEIRFYQQTDRSAMTHINQVSARYEDVFHDIGAFPDDEKTALAFDIRLNHDMRCRKGEVFELMVDEKMLVHWMTHYLGEGDPEGELAVSKVKEVRRAIFMNK
ncbi:DUF6933 domain-containing protein [Buttiauxella agrestis]|uniref:DUF6933 domain-containing protein n=1 Tax=Buttiauxella agrestis TaxID=82977 RepID=UPI003975A156